MVGGVTAAVLAIDGGNSKTDVCLISENGRLLGYARGPGSNHQVVGLDLAFAVLAGLVVEAAAEAGIDSRSTLAHHAAVFLAGADFPREVEMLLARISPAGWAQDKSPRAALPKSILLARSWEEAIKEATIRNVPILFTTALAT